MFRSISSNALTLFIVILVCCAIGLTWARDQYMSSGPLSNPICMRIEKGAHFETVSRDLESQGAVTYGTIFRLGADYTGKSQELKFGSYLVPAGASMTDIVSILTQGGQSTCGRDVNFRISVNSVHVIMRDLNPQSNRYEEILSFNPVTEVVPAVYLDATQESDMRWRVTLAEGVTSWQVVESLKRADFLEGSIAVLPAEGSLAPDSYEIERGTARSVLIDKMKVRQSAVMAKLWAARASDLPFETPEQALVLASLVEKETGVPDERGKVASVFINRLSQGMKLQTDPSVIYGVTQGEGVLGRGLRQSELERDTPFNTYVNFGLPPTPIANPGRQSIEATLNPDKTPYIFFVADGSGGHAFAVNLADHNLNVAAWRKIETQKAPEN
ncbi:MAG: UPF0755 protein [Paracoccaceae bacterium]|jgi:UPF0755 protein